MFKLSWILAGAFVAACAQDSYAKPTPQDAAAKFEAALKNSESVKFYLYSRSGEWDLQRSDFIEISSVKIERRCGGNCARFMKDVIEHMRSSTMSNCVKGLQSVLIETDSGESVFYSMSGRFILHDGNCYFNEEDVGDIIRADGFIFE